jgi:hypothetical protein
MGAPVSLKCVGGVVRGSRRELKRYAKAKNIPDKQIGRDDHGWFIKARDRGQFHKRRR